LNIYLRISPLALMAAEEEEGGATPVLTNTWEEVVAAEEEDGGAIPVLMAEEEEGGATRCWLTIGKAKGGPFEHTR
jgi:hypothetical protein